MLKAFWRTENKKFLISWWENAKQEIEKSSKKKWGSSVQSLFRSHCHVYLWLRRDLTTTVGTTKAKKKKKNTKRRSWRCGWENGMKFDALDIDLLISSEFAKTKRGTTKQMKSFSWRHHKLASREESVRLSSSHHPTTTIVCFLRREFLRSFLFSLALLRLYWLRLLAPESGI